MLDNQDKIELYRPEINKRGFIVLKSHYCNLVAFIVAAINRRTEKEITLSELLDEVLHTFPGNFEINLTWFLLQVKQDLEVRGILKTRLGRHRIQRIQINKRKLKTHAKTFLPETIKPEFLQ